MTNDQNGGFCKRSIHSEDEDGMIVTPFIDFLSSEEMLAWYAISRKKPVY
jgi:hypothetical protein